MACGRGEAAGGPKITLSGSALGDEGAMLRRQIGRFEKVHPGVDVEIERTPDDATQRHQLFVQWLNARVGRPDVLQLDVVWTPEFAAAGWILPLDRFGPHRDAFLPAAIRANTYAGRLYAIPWFADVGLLYWRTDLLPHAPHSLAQLVRMARRGVSGPLPPGVPAALRPRAGIVWQGARYEGLVTTFLEVLGAYGGRILDDQWRVRVDSPAGVAALSFLRDEIDREHVTPPEVLTWHEEETRFAFQNGNAVFMRNWPYAYALMADAKHSRVAGRFSVATMPAAASPRWPDGHPTAALGGAELAINAHSAHPELAYQLIAFLTAPRQMLERAAVVGELPTRRALYADPRLGRALAIPLAQVRDAVEHAAARPVIPIYSQLSELLQIHLHRALVGEETPADALRAAAQQMEALIERTHIRSLLEAGHAAAQGEGASRSRAAP